MHYSTDLKDSEKNKQGSSEILLPYPGFSAVVVLWLPTGLMLRCDLQDGGLSVEVGLALPHLHLRHFGL